VGAEHVLIDGGRNTAAGGVVMVVVNCRAGHRRRIIAGQAGTTVCGHVVGHMMVVLVAVLVRVIGVGR